MRNLLKLVDASPRLPGTHQRGGALVEYTIVVSVLLVFLLANPHVIRDLAHAIRDAYTSFVYALSISWI